MALDGIFLHNLIEELNIQLEGTRVEKVFQPARDEIVLLLRRAGFAGRLIISAAPKSARLHLTENAPENPPQAPMFCMLLRKHLGGAKLLGISQPGFERVAKLSFESRNEMGDTVYPQVYVELITGSPNIIFTDSEGIIVDSVRRSDIEKNTRMVQPGARYTLPKSQDKLSFKETDVAAGFKKLGLFANRPIHEAILNTFDGVSPLVAREIAFAAEADLDATVGSTTEKKLRWALERLWGYGNSGEPYILYRKGSPYDFSYMPINQYGAEVTCKKVESFSKLLDIFYINRGREERMRQQSQDILKLLTNLSSRVARKLAARRSDLKKCADREKYRIYGELIKANIYAINRGDNVARVVNYYSDNGEEISIPLNVALSPADNAQKYFKDYKKYCVAEKTLQDLISDSEQEARYIDSVFDALSRAETAADLSAIRDELAMSGYIKRPANLKKNKGAVSKPLRFVSTDGFTILVGKNNLQNDELTLKTASKNDMWFHTKNIHGSHAILFLEGKEPTETAITEAAGLAAYFSKARESSSVPVDYTLVKNVKKPTGARPGMVIYTTNQTVFVTPQAELCEKLRG